MRGEERREKRGPRIYAKCRILYSSFCIDFGGEGRGVSPKSMLILWRKSHPLVATATGRMEERRKERTEKRNIEKDGVSCHCKTRLFV